jgi:hypothetical protein
MKLYNLYTYAFLKTPIESLTLPVGIANPLLLITGGDLSAVVEPEVCLDTLQNDDERLIQSVLCHDRVICQLFQQTTILPLRFGTSFLETENLLTHLCSHGQEYQEKILDSNNFNKFYKNSYTNMEYDPIATSGGNCIEEKILRVFCGLPTSG